MLGFSANEPEVSFSDIPRYTFLQTVQFVGDTLQPWRVNQKQVGVRNIKKW